MKSKFDKKTAALVLFGAALLLLIANLVAVMVEGSSKSFSSEDEITSSKIDSVFLFSLHSFGLSDSWITEIKSKKSNKIYDVKIPSDLSIPVILVELNSNFGGGYLKVESEEKKFGGDTETKIFLKDQVKLISHFSYDENIHRRAGTISFILKNYELSNSGDSVILDIPDPFSPLLYPSMRNFNISQFILSKKKTFSILLDDNITEIKYKLLDDFSENRIKATMFTIIKDFPNAAFFVIDNESDLYNSSAFKLIRNELLRRNIKLLKLSDFSDLEYDANVQLKNDFDNLMKNLADGDSLMIAVNYDGFENLIPEIRRFRKIGYKIVHPSLIARDEK